MKIQKTAILLVSLLVSLSLAISCRQKDPDIHEHALTVNTHVDTPVSRPNGFHISKLQTLEKGGGQVDFPRMKQGGLDTWLNWL